MIHSNEFNQNNQTIQTLGSQQALTEEQQEELVTAIAENVTELLLSGPLTPEQAAAINNFLAG